MENILPRYKRPLPSIGDPVNNVEHWNTAVDAFDEKDFKKSVIEIINYMNIKLLEGIDTSEDIEINHQQGSVKINIQITATFFSVTAPFLKITEKTNKVALLRKVAEVNFSPLTLAQIQLENDTLSFKHKMPIELAQPNKVYDMLRNIAVYADEYDDLFINKYKATYYNKPTNVSLSDNEKTIIWLQISNIFEDYKNYTQFFEEKRWNDYQWDIITISLLKLSNMPYIQGKIRTDLIQYISILFDPDLDFKYRVDKGVNFMKLLIAKSQDEIMQDIYHAEQLLSLRWRSSKQIITDRLKSNLERVQQYEKEEKDFNLSYYLQFTLLKLIYDYNLEANYKKIIEDVLENVAGTPPEEAAPKLAKVFYDLQGGHIDKEIKKEKKGFFSKLFN